MTLFIKIFLHFVLFFFPNRFPGRKKIAVFIAEMRKSKAYHLAI